MWRHSWFYFFFPQEDNKTASLPYTSAQLAVLIHLLCHVCFPNGVVSRSSFWKMVQNCNILNTQTVSSLERVSLDTCTEIHTWPQKIAQPSWGYSLLLTSTCSGVRSSVVSMGWRGISALAPAAAPPPSFFDDLGVFRAVPLAYPDSSPLWPQLLLRCIFFPLLICCPRDPTTDADWPCQVVGLSWSQLALAPLGMGGSLCQFPTEATCLALPIPTTEILPCKPSISMEMG